MSGGVSNLGMGLAYPLYYNLSLEGQKVADANPLTAAGPRTADQLRSDWNAWTPQWQRVQNEMASAQSAAGQASFENLQQQGMSPTQDYLSAVSTLSPGYQGFFDAQKGAFDAALQQKQQNEALQQQAYIQQNGGGFTGGLLNDTYSQPFSNVLGANTTGSQGFAGGMMGSGQSPAVSTGLNAWMPQGMGPSPSAANSGGWGGPFGVKNPWSMS